MPIHPYYAARLPLLEGLDRSGVTEADVSSRLARFAADEASWTVPHDVTVEDRTTQGDGGPLALRVYRPRSEPRAALVWLHGGGFRRGDLEMPESHIVAAELAHRSSTLVVAVDYRLAGNGVHYPAPVDDVVAAWRWLSGEVPEGLPVALGGGSAGAAIALSAALRVGVETGRNADGLLLAYPIVHFPVPAIDLDLEQEMRALPPLVRFSADTIEEMVGEYVGRLSDIPAGALPGGARLDDLPPTAIVLSEFDDLRPSGELLARQLSEVGVENRTLLCRGMLHGHLNRLPGLEEAGASLDFFAEALAALPR